MQVIDAKIPRPPQWDEWYSHPSVLKGRSYSALNNYIKLSDIQFKLLQAKVCQLAKSTLVFSVPLHSQAPEKLATLWDQVHKFCPDMHKYEDAWPAKALVARFLAFQLSSTRGQFLLRHSKPPKKANRPTLYVGKIPSRQALAQIQYPNHVTSPLSNAKGTAKPVSSVSQPGTASVTLPSVANVSARTFVNLSAPSFRPPASPVPANSGKARRLSSTTTSPRFTPYPRHLPSYTSRRKIGCFACGYLAPCAEQYITQLSTNFHGPLLETLTIDDYHLALLLRLTKAERHDFLDSIVPDHCSRLRSLQLQERFDDLEVNSAPLSIMTPPSSQRLSNPLHFNVSHSSLVRRSRSNGSSPQMPTPSPNWKAANSSATPKADHAVYGLRCNRCDFKPALPTLEDDLEAFLRRAGLSLLTPAFAMLQVTTDVHLADLCQMKELYRTQFFASSKDILFTPFQQFALQVAFRHYLEDSVEG